TPGLYGSLSIEMHQISRGMNAPMNFRHRGATIASGKMSKGAARANHSPPSPGPDSVSFSRRRTTAGPKTADFAPDGPRDRTSEETGRGHPDRAATAG